MYDSSDAAHGAGSSVRTSSPPSTQAGLWLPLALASGALILSGQAAAGQNGSGAWFTEEQAARGHSVFTTECGGCHGYTMTEILAEADTADRFYSRISATMPWEDPGALPLQQYADIVAFFLSEMGFPAGDTELPPDRNVMVQIIPADVDAAAAAAETSGAGTAEAASPPAEVGQDSRSEDSAEPPGAGPAGTTYFTAAQAEQGLRDFTVACGGCHGADMVDVFQTYETVAEYYNFITGAMPADDPGNLAPRQYLSVIAYMLSESGFPAGDTELTNDPNLLGQIEPGAAPEH